MKYFFFSSSEMLLVATPSNVLISVCTVIVTWNAPEVHPAAMGTLYWTEQIVICIPWLDLFQYGRSLLEHQQVSTERTIWRTQSRQIVHGVIAATTRRREYSLRLHLPNKREESHLHAKKSCKSIIDYLLRVTGSENKRSLFNPTDVK